MAIDRQDYQWRPNDNSVQTRLRYELEAEHWHRSFKAAERKNRTTSYSSDLSVIGAVVTILVSLVTLIVISVIDVVKWMVVRYNS